MTRSKIRAILGVGLLFSLLLFLWDRNPGTFRDTLAQVEVEEAERIRLLAQKFPQDQLPVLAGLAPSVVEEYLELIRQYESCLKLYSGDITRSQRGPAQGTVSTSLKATKTCRSDGGGR